MVVAKELRYSHAEGLTFARYDQSGQSLLTAGADGDVRMYASLSDDEVSFKVGSCVTALSVKDFISPLMKDREIIVASETNDVRTYSLPEGAQQEMLIRFTAQVNSICASSDSSLIAAGASDFSVKVVDKKDMSQKHLTGHEAPVLCVVFCPGDQLLASSSCDGALKIWNISKQECIQSMDIFPKCNDTSTSKILCIIDWCRGKTQESFNGESFASQSRFDTYADESKAARIAEAIAVPSEKGIKLISTENWSELCKLEGSHSELVSIAKFSPCGNFIASASVNGEIAIWELSTRKELEFMKHDAKICSIDWNPNGTKEILFADEMGRFSVFSDVVPMAKKEIKPQDTADDVADLSDDSDFDSGMAKTGRSRKRAHQSDDDDDDDVDDEPPVGSAHKKHRVQNLDNFLDDEAEDDDDDDDDIANISINLIKEGFIPKIEGNLKEDDQGSLKDFIVEDKAWNSVGIIRCHSEDEVSTIDIEFHDASLHHPLHFTNVMNHTMAALSTTAAVLACRPLEGIPSKLVCLHFGTWDSTKEWTVSMTKGEEIVGVAVNSHFIAVATNCGYVRIFTVGGLQYHVISVAGPIVAVSMCETQLMIVYHQATGKPPSQCLGMQLYEIGKLQWTLCVEQQLPISFKNTLIWIGFSAEETPFTIDSKGILRMFQRSFGHAWTPVLNLKDQTKTKSDNYWVVGITENPPEVRAVLCKAANFPATLPRPVPSALSFRIPLCDKDTEKSQLEESLVRNRIFNQYHDYHKKKRIEKDEDGIEQSKTTEIQLLMKLFALSCKSDRIFRAVEICELMPNADTVNLAIQYATKMRRMNLAQRLVELARKKAEIEEEEDDEVDDDISIIDDEPEGEIQHPRSSNQKPFSMRTSVNPFSVRQPKSLIYNGRRSIGRPRGIHKVRKDSTGSFSDRSEVENEENVEANGDDDIDHFEGDDVEMNEDEIEMDSNTNDSATMNTQSKTHTEEEDVLSNQTRSNPFKLTPNTKAKAAGSSRGTSYFESLKSTLPPKNKLGSSGVQQQNTGKKIKEGTKQAPKQSTLFGKTEISSIEKSKEPKQKQDPNMQSKRITGFMLFREHLSMEKDGLTSEELVNKSLEQWKSLSAEEKKSWNAKAMAEGLGNDTKICQQESKILDGNDNCASRKSAPTLQEVKENADQSKNRAKSKLAAFAFKKT